jgi:hypothetical protein
MKIFFVIILTTLWMAPAFALDKVSDCQSRPEFLEAKSLSNLKSLPSMVFVGKSAQYYVEDKNDHFRMWGEQSFVKGSSRIVCASATTEKSRDFSIYAPTLMDLTGDKSVGDSYWQFHMVANSRQFGIWNQKSRLFSKANDLESALGKIEGQVQFRQLSHDEYEMIITREDAATLEVLSVRFDAISNLP